MKGIFAVITILAVVGVLVLHVEQQTENVFKSNDEYAEKHPDFLINTKTATVCFDDIVVAKKYVGPVKN